VRATSAQNDKMVDRKDRHRREAEDAFAAVIEQQIPRAKSGRS
jgi:hypothetical protein